MESSGAAMSALIQWSDQAVHMKDIAERYTIPNIFKVIKGQYRNIGVSKSVHSELYIHSVKETQKVMAEAVKLKESKKVMTMGDQKYSLPMTYKGWFELLSADGKAIKAIQGVQELAHHFPAKCLVRESVKAFVPRSEGSSPGEVTLDKTRTIHAGEVLSLIKEVWVPFPMGKMMAKRRVLKCEDSSGQEVLFGLEQKGMFSPVAGPTNISGVHTVKGLLEKFRLPLMVRLVHGVIPTKMEKGFTGVFRLVNVYTDENVFVCPFKKDAKMVPISTREPLKLVPVQKFEAIAETEECQALERRCTDMLENYMNSIHMLISMPDPASLIQQRREENTINPERTPGKTSVGLITNPSMSPDEEDELFQEIDGIYQYVREGGPLPKSKSKAKRPAPKPPKQPVVDSYQTLMSEDTNMESKMQHLDLMEEEEEVPAGNFMKRQDSYNWEEPIYELPEKVREQKRKLEESRRQSRDSVAVAKSGFDPVMSSGYNTLQSGFDTPPESFTADSDESLGGNDHPVPPPAPPLPKASPSSPPVLDLTIPVANLRQALKSAHAESSAHMDSGQAGDIIEQVYKSVPPPIPPKRYSDEPPGDSMKQVAGGAANVSIINRPDGHKRKHHQHSSRPHKSTPSPTKPQVKGQSPSNAAISMSQLLTGDYRTSSSSGSSNTPQPHVSRVHGNSPQSASNSHQPSAFHHQKTPPHHSHHSNKMRQSPGAGSPSPHPPYVAVARVGDYQQDPTASVLVNPELYNKHRTTNLDNGRPNMHSVYL